MKLLQKKDDKIVFIAEIEETLANAIRRYINHIPTLAIDEVEIIKNDSPLYDESISHRMGLIPIRTDKAINEKSSYELKLNEKREGLIYSGDLKGGVKIAYDKIPITSLKKGQEIEINASIKSGIGKNHAKFSPGLLNYRDLIKIKIDKECPKEVVEVCPLGILTTKDGKVNSQEEYRCDMCEACTDFCKKMKKDSITLEPTNELVITLESFGQHDVKELLEKSADILSKDLNLLLKSI